jgi:hypothetical integral membrane protein (TIGR02206 family)
MTRPTIDPFYEFHAFSAFHGVVVAAFAVAVAVICCMGVRRRGTEGLRRAERAAGWVILGAWAVSTVYWLLPANFDLTVSLPLHMCDMTGLLAPLVLLTGRRPFRTLLYFWGLGLSIHGVLTPVLELGWFHISFVLYWLVHLSIIGTAVYDVVVRQYRPQFRDCVIATLACSVWLGAVFAVNLSLQLNYGYVGNITPERPTVIDGLGPWPLRVYKMVVAVIGLFVAMWLPWAIAQRVARAQTDEARPVSL